MHNVVDLVDDLLLEPRLHLRVECHAVVPLTSLEGSAIRHGRSVQPANAPLTREEARAVVYAGEVVGHLFDTLDCEVPRGEDCTRLEVADGAAAVPRVVAARAPEPVIREDQVVDAISVSDDEVAHKLDASLSLCGADRGRGRPPGEPFPGDSCPRLRRGWLAELADAPALLGADGLLRGRPRGRGAGEMSSAAS